MAGECVNVWTLLGPNDPIPANQPAIAHPQWVARSLARLEIARAGGTSYQDVMTADPQLLLGIIAAERAAGSAVHIIDVGGNLGQLAEFVHNAMDDWDIRWSVVEHEEFLRAALPLTDHPSSVKFVTSLRDLENVEGSTIVYFGSSFQYVPEHESYVGALVADLDPKWVIISDALIAGDGDCFDARQEYYESSLHVRFICQDCLDRLMNSFGLEVAVRVTNSDSRTQQYISTTRQLSSSFPIILSLNLAYVQRANPQLSVWPAATTLQQTRNRLA